ncbi:MAG: DUF4363 family protein [Firmicutes bacterium]|nr:DUF4363 family protein [Bacillota bacterium]
MKLWIVMCLIMLAIVVGGSLLERSILKATDYLSHILDSAKDAVRDNQWQVALDLRNKVDEKWRKQQKTWSPFIHNSDLNAITVSLTRLQSFLESKEQAHALAEISQLEVLLLQLHGQEVLTLKNVF